MKNKLTDLCDHICMQLERINQDDVGEDELLKEAKRTEQISTLVKDYVSIAIVTVKAAQVVADNLSDTPVKLPPMFELPAPNTKKVTEQ